MKTPLSSIRYTFVLSLFFTVSVLFAGCGDSSVNDDGDPDPDPEIEESQREAIIASFLGAEMNFTPPDEEEEEFALKGIAPRWAMAKTNTNAQECPGGGSQTVTQETKNVGSPYANQLEVQRMVSDNCRYDESGDSFVDGITESGLAEPINEHEYRVFYFSTSDLSGDPDSGGFHVSRLENPESDDIIRWESRGIMHNCLDCSNPQAGGSWEVLVSMEWAWITDEGEYRTWTGQSSSQPASYIINIDETADRAEMTWNGRFGSSINTSECSFEVDAMYTSVSPIVIENFEGGEDTKPVSGEMVVADLDGGWSHTVEFRDGDVYVDGVRIDPEEYEDYIEECVFEI